MYNTPSPTHGKAYSDECTDLASVRHERYREAKMRGIFKNVKAAKIVSCLKELGLYQFVWHLQRILYIPYIYKICGCSEDVELSTK